MHIFLRLNTCIASRHLKQVMAVARMDPATYGVLSQARLGRFLMQLGRDIYPRLPSYADCSAGSRIYLCRIIRCNFRCARSSEDAMACDGRHRSTWQHETIAFAVHRRLQHLRARLFNTLTQSPRSLAPEQCHFQGSRGAIYPVAVHSKRDKCIQRQAQSLTFYDYC